MSVLQHRLLCMNTFRSTGNKLTLAIRYIIYIKAGIHEI